jgi:hypothetical protein
MAGAVVGVVGGFVVGVVGGFVVVVGVVGGGGFPTRAAASSEALQSAPCVTPSPVTAKDTLRSVSTPAAVQA